MKKRLPFKLDLCGSDILILLKRPDFPGTKTERNMRLFLLYLDGKNFSQLAKTYKLSKTMTSWIVHRMTKKILRGLFYDYARSENRTKNPTAKK